MQLTNTFTRYAQQGDYMPQPGCPCLNMVTAVIDFYKRQPPPYRLRTIYLDRKHWRLFTEDLKRIDDTYCADAVQGVEIAHSDVTVKRGSMFQRREMQYDFYPTTREQVQETIVTHEEKRRLEKTIYEGQIKK